MEILLEYNMERVRTAAKETLGNMKRSAPIFILIVFLGFRIQVASQTPPSAVAQHGPNFESERKQADELFLAQKPLEALPLYEDLCRQDPTVAVFAERYGAGLLAKEATLSDSAERLKVHQQAIAEFKRAQSLGDNSAFVRNVLSLEGKSFVGAIISGNPLTVGYTYQGKPDAQTVFRQAEAAFGRSDLATALQLYIQAAGLDPDWYAPILCVGDTYFRMKDGSNAGVWFAKAIAIDPDRETAYRYWGDALFRAGDRDGAREKFVESVVAEPYVNPPMSELAQWAKVTGHQIVQPAITRPDFTTPDGILRIDPSLAASTQDGRSSWIVYQQYRVAHGARTLNQPIVAGGSDANAVVTPSGYRHTIAEEHAAMRAMLAEIETKLKSGSLTEDKLDPSIRNIRILEKSNVLGAWIALNAADAGIRSDYPAYRAHHREHLIDYVNHYLIQ
jgi:tetratricopeptide (TPR) repeat protein